MGVRIYVETSVISYLASDPSRDVVVAGHQITTRQWWNQAILQDELLISTLVRREASEGALSQAQKRI